MAVKIGSLVDGVAGYASRLLHVRAAEHDTTADLARYLDLSPGELFPEPQRVPSLLRRPVYSTRSRIVEALSFTSEHACVCPKYRLRHDRDYAANHTVHARWMHPRQGPRRSLMLYVHGWLEPGPWIEETTLLPKVYRELDVDCAHIQLPFHGKRNPRGSLFHGEHYFTADLVRSLEAIRQSIIDIRSLMMWFRSQGYEQIGVMGLSLGGSLTMVLACLSPMPDYIVPIVSHLDLLDAVENAPILWRMKSDLERFGVGREERAEIFRRIGLSELQPVLPAERQLWVAARDDMYLSAASVERQWERWNQPPILWVGGGHMTFPVSINRIVRRMNELKEGLIVLPTSPG